MSLEPSFLERSSVGASPSDGQSADLSGVPEPAPMLRLLAAADAGLVDLVPVIRRPAARAAAPA